MGTPHAPTPVSFGEALRFWLKLGFISFGGPAGQIAIMHRELVEQRHWISEKRFLHALNYCMLLPGPEAQQLATYIGWLMHRTWGGIVAGALFVLPSLFILIGLSWAYVAFGNVPWVAGLFYGIKPAVAAIVLQAVHRIGSKTLKTPARAPVLWAIAVLSFIAIAVLKIPFPWVVLGAALTGWIGSQVAPGAVRERWRPRLRQDIRPSGAYRRRHPHPVPRALQQDPAGPGAGGRRAAVAAAHGRACWPGRAGTSRRPTRWRRWAGSSPRRRC